MKRYVVKKKKMREGLGILDFSQFLIILKLALIKKILYPISTNK